MSKPVTKVDQKFLIQAVERAEEGGPLRNLSELWKSTCEIYNSLVGDRSDLKEISPSVVYLRARDWKIPCKTVAGKTVVEVDRTLLESAIQEAEKDGPLSNLNELWQKAAEIYNRSSSVAITHSIVCGRVKDFSISYQTKAGKKGRGAGVPMDPEQKRRMNEARAAAKAAGGGTRKSKFRNHPGREASRQAQLEQLRINDAMRFSPLVELAVDGNRKAADKLFCLGCVGYATAEVRRCSDIGCSKWLGRPFQKIAENASAEELEAAEQSEMEVNTEELEAVA